jgi:hypothetical protein
LAIGKAGRSGGNYHADNGERDDQSVWIMRESVDNTAPC